MTDSPFFADDRGNVVDFYEGEERVAKLDREAEVDGKPDQSAFEQWGGGQALKDWIIANGFKLP